MSSVTGDRSRWSARPEPAQVELVLAQIDALPACYPVAGRLLRPAGGMAGVRELVRFIESDAHLTSRVLSQVGRGDRAGEAASIEEAVALLGADEVRHRALSIEVFETFSRRMPAGSAYFDRGGFWKHALAAGCAAELLARGGAGEGSAGVPPAEAFLCGLLHDLGKVVLAACFPRAYDRAAEKADRCLLAIADAERELFGLDHTIAGGRLASRWGLPPAVEATVGLHHGGPAMAADRADWPEHLRVVRLADGLVRALRIGYSGNHGPAAGPEDVFGGLPDARGEAARFREALFELIERRAGGFAVEPRASRGMLEEAVREAQARLARANRLLADTACRLEEQAACGEALGVFREALAGGASLESVCLAAASAARAALPAVPVAVLAVSRARGIAAVAGGPRGAEAAGLEIVAADGAEFPAGVFAEPARWRGPDVLGVGWRDRVADRLGQPAGVCYPILLEGQWTGAIVAGEPLPGEPPAALAVLAGWIGPWLEAAEKRAQADRLNRQLADVNRQLVEAQSEASRSRALAMVGEMAAGAAHELNNPLAVISGRAQMLVSETAGTDSQRAAEAIADHSHKASAIVAELMEFAKPDPPDRTDWPVETLLADLRRAWAERSGLSENTFGLTLSDDVPPVHADAVQMRKLFDELIRNAVEATRQSPQPRLVVNCWYDLADERVVVRVEDNGVGMPPEVLERATAPFFSHRPAGRGRGLGLSRAARYAEVNGGSLRLWSRPGEGTVALVSIPAARPVREPRDRPDGG